MIIELQKEIVKNIQKMKFKKSDNQDVLCKKMKFCLQNVTNDFDERTKKK